MTVAWPSVRVKRLTGRVGKIWRMLGVELKELSGRLFPG